MPAKRLRQDNELPPVLSRGILSEPDPKATAASPLFRPPLEIRQQIYRNLFHGELWHINAVKVALNADRLSWWTEDPSRWKESHNYVTIIAVLSVSRLITQKATPSLYRKYVFEFDSGWDLRYLVWGRPLYSELSKHIRRARFTIRSHDENEKIWLRRLRGCYANSECDLEHVAGLALKNQLPALEILDLEFLTDERVWIHEPDGCVYADGWVYIPPAEVFAETIAVFKEEVVRLQKLIVIGINDEAVELEMRNAMTRPMGTEKI